MHRIHQRNGNWIQKHYSCQRKRQKTEQPLYLQQIENSALNDFTEASYHWPSTLFPITPQGHLPHYSFVSKLPLFSCHQNGPREAVVVLSRTRSVSR